MLVVKSIPEDPKVYYENGLAALENDDPVVGEASIQKLKEFPEYAAKQKLLAGMLNLGTAKPLLAIPLLEEAAKEPDIRKKALTHLGNAFLRSAQRSACISTYETLLQEDEDADDVRLSLANVFQGMISWEDSLKHLLILRDRNYEPSIVHELIGDVYFDLGRSDEAAVEFEAAFRADVTDPTNARRALKVVRCAIGKGNVQDLEDFLPSLDNASARSCAVALELVKENKLEEAIAGIENALEHAPGDAGLNRVYGQIVAEMASEEKAVEALKRLRRPLEFNCRNVKLFEVVVRLAGIAKKEKLAALAQQNVDQLKTLDEQFLVKLNEVIKTRDDIQGRLDLGDLALEAGRFETAQACYQSVSLIDETQEVAHNKSRPSTLVSLDAAFNDLESDVAPTESNSEPEKTPEPEATESPASVPDETEKTQASPAADAEPADTSSEPSSK
jgi:tetratricopeptide (TPR) repeat protein